MVRDDTKVGLGEKLSKEHLSSGKRKNTGKIVMVIILILIAGGVYVFLNSGKASKFEFFKVAKKDLRELVQITGNVEAGATLNLTFRQSGQVEKIFFDVTQKIKKDEVVARLKNRDDKLRLDQAKANLAGAYANLNQKLAGSTEQEIKIAQSSVDQAQAAAEKVSIDWTNAKEEVELIKQKYLQEEKRAQLLVDDAKSKFDFAVTNKSNTGKTQDLTVETAKQDLEAQLFSTASQIQQSLLNLKSVVANDGNSLLGSDYFRLDQSARNQGHDLYYQTKYAFDPLYIELRASSAYEPAKLEEFSVKEQELVGKLLQSQKIVSDALSILPASSTLSADQITILKSRLITDSSAISGSLAALNIKYQAILTAVLNVATGGDNSSSGVQSAENFYNQQLQSFAQTQINHQVDLNSRMANIKSLQAQYQVQLAAVESAKASLELKKVGPRSVDVAFYRAQVLADQVAVSMAEEGFEKTLMRAPIDGVISRRNIELAEDALSSSSVAAQGKGVFQMISNEKYKIDANIAEVDINKIKVGSKAEIVFDAVGDQTKFEGTISKIDPVETKIQDVVFYNAEVVVETQDARIKPGMTATVDILLKQAMGVLYVPEKAVQMENGKSFVRVQNGKDIKNIDVETGLRDLQGDLEIKSGLIEGQEIILRTVK